MRKLHIADTEEVRRGDVTDVYFLRTAEVLRRRQASRHVCMEVICKSFPDPAYRWGVFAGLEDVCTVLEGRPVNVRSLPEGSVFFPGEPVLTIEGNYLDFGELETAVLGCLCQASGIATRASRCRVAAGDTLLASFGARRMHPSIAPMVERAAFIGGCDGVATVASARLIGEPPIGTIPHALILQMDDTADAAEAYDEIMPPEVPRVVLIDTFQDEKFEALRVAERLGERLLGVRLDTPSSRRGNFAAILEEVRWELDTHGHGHVKLFVSGGLSTGDILELKHLVYAFGVGTSISSAATLDYSMDIVSMEGNAVAKRGKKSGEKDLLRCRRCLRDQVVLRGAGPGSCCGEPRENILVPVMEQGVIIGDLPPARDIRSRAMNELAVLQKNTTAEELLGL